MLIRNQENDNKNPVMNNRCFPQNRMGIHVKIATHVVLRTTKTKEHNFKCTIDYNISFSYPVNQISPLIILCNRRSILIRIVIAKIQYISAIKIGTGDHSGHSYFLKFVLLASFSKRGSHLRILPSKSLWSAALNSLKPKFLIKLSRHTFTGEK